jgi:cell division protein FtsB
MSFVLLVLGLLGGGLVCLLVVNTTLAAASISISRLQQRNASAVQQIQQLQQQVGSERSDAVLAREAKRLGMRPVQAPSFVNLRTGKIAEGR